MEMKRPRRGVFAAVLGTVVVLVVAGVCARLGVWQLDRLAERRALNAVVSERLALAPLELASAPADTTGLSYRMAEFVGEYDAARGVVLAGRSHQGTSGVHLLLPLRLEDGSAVLVQRGWLPALDAARVDPASYAEGGRVRVRGLLATFPELGLGGGSAGSGAAGFRRVWYRLDGSGLREQLPYRVSSLYLQELPDAVAAAGQPVALPVPELDDGPHLGYAIQWFSFGLIALVGWLVLLVRREGRAAEEGAGGRPRRGPRPVAR
jgi:surfeit locus 1 family protein